MKRGDVKRKLFEVVEDSDSRGGMTGGEWAELAQAAVEYILELEDQLADVQNAANRGW